jgi:hypothetical protein
MSLGVEFEEQDYMKKNYTQASKQSGASAYLIKNGWAHDQSSANKLMVFIAILFILASGLVYYLFVVRPEYNRDIVLPETIIKKLSPEMQSKIRAAQR